MVNDTRQTVVWAVGSGGFAYHGPVNRGQAEVVLLPNATTQANLPLPADVQVRLRGQAVPRERGTLGAASCCRLLARLLRGLRGSGSAA